MTIYGKEAIEYWEKRKAMLKERKKTIFTVIAVAIAVGSLIYYSGVL